MIKFIHFETKELFNDAIKNNIYDNDAISFIKDTQEIYTHN